MEMKKIISFLVIISAIVLSGCIKETFPTNYATDAQVAKSPTAMEALVNAIPTSMIGWGNQPSGQLEACGYPGLAIAFEDMLQDVVVAGVTGWNTWATYSTMSNPTHWRQHYAWFLYYAWIKNANDIIGLIDPNTQNKVEQHYLGVAHAFRAFYYLVLVRKFEYKFTPHAPPTDDRVYDLGVPIVTETTTEEQAKNNPRATVEQNYEMIFADLEIAERLLADYTPPTKAFPSLAVVYGLYAQAYLERGTAEVSGAYENAALYARKAINESGCTPLTLDQWHDPINGFNNANSQNSWMWGVLISQGNVSMFSNSYCGLNSAEQRWIVYGYRVGRSASRRFYESIPDNDFRKYSWLDSVFYDRMDTDGNIIRPGVDSYNGFEYRLALSAEALRSEVNTQNWVTRPWIYNAIKFRPAGGVTNSRTIGGAMDHPIMRVEEMYLIEAEAVAKTQGIAQGSALLHAFMAHRYMYGTYSFTATDLQSLIDEIIFQKRVEFWGEGVLFYDSKRLKLGLNRGYRGINSSAFANTFDVPGIFPLWNCHIPESEEQGNPALRNKRNPVPLTATNLNLFWAKSNPELVEYYGCDLDNPDGD